MHPAAQFVDLSDFEAEPFRKNPEMRREFLSDENQRYFLKFHAERLQETANVAQSMCNAAALLLGAMAESEDLKSKEIADAKAAVSEQFGEAFDSLQFCAHAVSNASNYIEVIRKLEKIK